ncbi:MAG: DNA-directed RNA polymerase subunit A' [Candidatus Woesearchaeota archaeon]|jgi:DNA-directed RNA polymerase subunit A'
MDTTNFVYKKIESISFGLLSPKMIKQMSYVKVVTPELYDREGYPVDGGLMDLRMGVIDPGLKCKTCNLKLKECPGHFGYIEMARPVVHIKFVPIVLNLLRCSCRDCGRILIPDEKMSQHADDLDAAQEESGLDGRRKVIKTIIASLKTISKCPHCKAKQGKITLEKPSTFMDNDKRVTPIEVRSRLEKIPDEDLNLFGISPQHARPEWMVLTIMAIPPVTMRPSITLETGERSEDDLTHKLGDIVRINQRLFENINAGAPEIIIEDLWDLLQYHITTFFDNEVAQLPPARHRNGQPLKTIVSRIKSKEGRIRNNLAGKRTNFNARTVVSPDPMLDINEIGVPEIVARKLTVPERATEWNMEYLKKFVEQGPDGYPGSNYIVRPDGRKKRITDETKEALLEEIQPGYVIERHLMDGDIALFNRQPTLHRMSMMCHKVRVLPGKTFRLNPSVCHPYNADFDGDEMNLHIPQTEEARAEAEILMLVETQLISPAYGLSIIGCMQDAISGNYVLTSNDFELSRKKAIQLLYRIRHSDFSRLPKKDVVTGKEIASCVLPPDFSFKGFTKNKEEIEIKDGQLIKGVLDSANLGGGKGMLLRSIHKKYGATLAADLISKFLRLGIEVLQIRGLSVAISDADLPIVAQKEIKSIIESSKDAVDDFIAKFAAGTLDALPGRSTAETVELRIMEALNKARNNCGEVVAKHASKQTGMSVMSSSGARGNIINLSQIASVVGQQSLRGKRISHGYKDRTLSCFARNDLSSNARGFIGNSFKSGLEPYEFFFAAMTGRDALMDTALRTPRSGYLYRRLENSMQDLKIGYDYSVRDANEKIIQFKYGEDALDVSKTEGGRINVKKIVGEVLSE